MHSYAIGFMFAGLLSACFIDSGVKRSVTRMARPALAVFATLFVVFGVASLIA